MNFQSLSALLVGRDERLLGAGFLGYYRFFFVNVKINVTEELHFTSSDDASRKFSAISGAGNNLGQRWWKIRGRFYGYSHEVVGLNHPLDPTD